MRSDLRSAKLPVLPRWPLLVALLLLAALLAALPGAASAQTPPEWNDDQGELTLTPPNGVEIIGIYKCARWSASAPYVLRLLNRSRNLYAICAGYDTRIRAEVHFIGEVDEAFGVDVLEDLKITNGTGQQILHSFSSLSPTESSDRFSNQPTRMRKHDNQQNQPGALLGLNAGETMSMTLDLIGNVESILSDGTPGTPDVRAVVRNSDYSETTLSWDLFDPVSEYEIERKTAVTVEAGDSVRIEYGDGVFFSVDGTIEGVEEYVDDTVEPTKTYQYRVRARGDPTMDWSAWSSYVLSGMEPSLDLDAPANVEVSRSHDNSQVIVSWTAPEGDFDNYTLQRQDLVIVEGSTIFANAMSMSMAGEAWLSGTTTMYTDSIILPGRTYEYRVAAVKNDVVGDYSDWARSSPVKNSLGDAPGDFRFVEEGSRLLDSRREFWMGWDAVDGADDYEVDVLVYGGGGRSMEHYIVSDPTYFQTSFGRVELRVRGRKQDVDLCGGGTARCYTEWTEWYGVAFTPEFEAMELPTRVPDASIDAVQADVHELLDSTLDQSGVDVDPSVAIQFAVLVGTVMVASVSVWAGWRRGMRPLGMGMGFSVLVISLYVAYVLLGIPAAWPIGAQSLVAVLGIIAFARQLGAFK